MVSAGGFALPALATVLFQRCYAADVEVYFGCGCFWHVQYAFAGLEQSLLNRTGSQVTARTAYAGSVQTGPDGLVCYHNPEGIADYAAMGHAEAVSVSMPEQSVDAFVATFWQVCPHGNRKDAMDSDHQYRSVIGIPGGMASPLIAKLSSDPAAAELSAGKGGDADTFGTNHVWVYDSLLFPATTAEKYHQFHDDFMRSAYDQQYHALQRFAAKSGCPGDASFTGLAERHGGTVIGGLFPRSTMPYFLLGLVGLGVAWLMGIIRLPSARDCNAGEEQTIAYMPI